MKAIIERKLRRTLITKPQGTLFTRVLMRFYTFFYSRRKHKKLNKEFKKQLE